MSELHRLQRDSSNKNSNKSNTCNGLDWHLIQKIDPYMLRETQDFETMQTLVNSFVFSTVNDTDRNVLQHPLSYRLVLNIQTVIRYMFECQEKLVAQIDEINEENMKLKQKNKILYKNNERSKSLLREYSEDYEKCPVCGKKFKTIKHVDGHIQKCHNLHFQEWKALRTDVPMVSAKEVERLHKEIDLLKTTLYEQTKHFTKTIDDFRKHSNAQRKLDKACTGKLKEGQVTIDFFEHAPKAQTMPRMDMSQHKKNEEPRQNIVYVEFESSDSFSSSSSSDEGMEDRMRKISKHVTKKVDQIRRSLPADYITAKQTAQVLEFDNDEYYNIKGVVRKQMKRDFPLKSSEGEVKSSKTSSSMEISSTKSSDEEIKKPNKSFQSSSESSSSVRKKPRKSVSSVSSQFSEDKMESSKKKELESIPVIDSDSFVLSDKKSDSSKKKDADPVPEIDSGSFVLSDEKAESSKKKEPQPVPEVDSGSFILSDNKSDSSEGPKI